jgi:predicted Zn-dependent peptidase
VPAAGLKPVPAEANFTTQTFNNTVYVVDYDMKQAEIVILTEGEKFDAKNIPLISMYNEYFGGGMSSVVFQDLRESKALAYSCYSVYRAPRLQNCHFIIFLISVLKQINCPKQWPV